MQLIINQHGKYTFTICSTNELHDVLMLHQCINGLKSITQNVTNSQNVFDLNSCQFSMGM